MTSGEWHFEQYHWHKERKTPWNLKGGCRWHALQARWHASKIGFTDMVALTFRRHAPEIAANVSKNNTLLKRLLDNACSTRRTNTG